MATWCHMFYTDFHLRVIYLRHLLNLWVGECGWFYVEDSETGREYCQSMLTATIIMTGGGGWGWGGSGCVCVCVWGGGV